MLPFQDQAKNGCYCHKTHHARHRNPIHLDIEDFENELNSMEWSLQAVKTAK